VLGVGDAHPRLAGVVGAKQAVLPVEHGGSKDRGIIGAGSRFAEAHRADLRERRDNGNRATALGEPVEFFTGDHPELARVTGHRAHLGLGHAAPPLALGLGQIAASGLESLSAIRAHVEDARQGIVAVESAGLHAVGHG